MRGQANLLALAVALIALTGAMVVGLAIADGAFATAESDATERQVGNGIAERLTSADGPLATRENVLNASAVASFDAADLRSTLPGLADRDVAVTLDDEPVAATDDDGVRGYSIERIVLVERTRSVEVDAAFDGTNRSVTLPRRTDRVDVRIDRSTNATVTSVRIDDRIVRQNESGVVGNVSIATSRYRTATVAIDADGRLAPDEAGVTYYPSRTEKALLEVTVDG